MPFKKTEIASNGVKLDTASITSVSLVKSWLNSTRNIKTIALKIILMMMLLPFTTSTENFATLGCPAPSSLLTRTLQSIISNFLIIIGQEKKKKNIYPINLDLFFFVCVSHTWLLRLAPT